MNFSERLTKKLRNLLIDDMLTQTELEHLGCMVAQFVLAKEGRAYICKS